LSYQLAELQRQLVGIQQQLDLFRRASIERQAAAASKVAQILLLQTYKELVRRGPPYPRFDDIEFRAFSENGEDGILLYIFSVIGTTNKRSVEMCAGDGVECNTANLIINHGWKGLLFDGNDEALAVGRDYYAGCQDTHCFLRPPDLVTAWITAENANSLIAGNGFAGEIDLLSLDMDGVDYWVWKAIDCIQPRVVVLEFNLDWGPEKAVSVPYQPDFRADYSKLPAMTWGASLTAFCKLGREKGYRLVGAHRGGWNGFFIRSGIGEDVFPEITPSQLFAEHLFLREWTPDGIPPGEWVEV
jgi:hypothetical protein